LREALIDQQAQALAEHERHHGCHDQRDERTGNLHLVGLQEGQHRAEDGHLAAGLPIHQFIRLTHALA